MKDIIQDYSGTFSGRSSDGRSLNVPKKDIEMRLLGTENRLLRDLMEELDFD